MKKTVTLLLALLTLNSFAQVTVEEKKVNIDGPKNGFLLSVPYGDQKSLEKALKDELKSWKGKYSEKGFIFVDDCKLKEMGDNTFDVYAKVEANPDGGGNISLAIDLGGAIMTSNEHPGKAKVINTKLYKFGVKAAKDVVGEEVKEEEKILKERNKELEDLEKEQEKLEKEIEDYKKKIEDNKKAIEEAKKNQEAKKEEIKTQEEKVKATEQKKEAVK
jgi:molecular chaperone DnaK (HSP70)